MIELRQPVESKLAVLQPLLQILHCFRQELVFARNWVLLKDLLQQVVCIRILLDLLEQTYHFFWRLGRGLSGRRDAVGALV